MNNPLVLEAILQWFFTHKLMQDEGYGDVAKHFAGDLFVSTGRLLSALRDRGDVTPEMMAGAEQAVQERPRGELKTDLVVARNMKDVEDFRGRVAAAGKAMVVQP